MPMSRLLLTFSPSTSREPFVNDGLGKDCMVLLTCGPKPDTSLVSRRGSGFSYGLFGRCAPMAMAVRFAGGDSISGTFGPFGDDASNV